MYGYLSIQLPYVCDSSVAAESGRELPAGPTEQVSRLF